MDSSNKNDKWIFLVPIDGNINKSVIETKNQINKIEKNQEKSETKLEEKDEEEYFNKNIFNINHIENNPENKKINENQDNTKIYIYSLISKNKDLSQADSSKVYMSEFLKKNWKIKIKRLLIKLKKRYTKQSQKINLKDPNNNINNNDFSDFNNNINNNEINNSINFDDDSKFKIKSCINNNICFNDNINKLNNSNNQKNLFNHYISNNNK